MDTTQIIIAVCGFTVVIAVGLIVYIWTDAKTAIKETVSEKTCNERREHDEEKLECMQEKLRNHRHDPKEGTVRIDL